MKLLTSILPRRPRTLPAGFWFTLLVVGCVAGVEVAGRSAGSDYEDLPGVAALMAVGGLVAARHRREPLPWVSAAGGWARRAGGRWAGWVRYDHGIDLRGTPPLPRRVPPAVGLAAVGLVLWAAAAAVGWAVLPGGWRVVGVKTVYVAYLVGLLTLWAALLAGTFVGVFVPVAVVDRWLKGWVGETDRRGAELAAVVIYLVLVATVAWAVPPAGVVGLCLLVAAAAWMAAAAAPAGGAAVLWRGGPGRPVYAVPFGRVLAVAVGLAGLLVLAVLLTACGGRLLTPPADDDPMWLTARLGSLAAWMLPGLVAVGLARGWALWRSDPARRTPAAAHVSGDDPAARRAVADRLRADGWRVRAAREPGAVGVEAVAPARSEATEFDPRWPLRLTAADLDDPEVRHRLARRDEIQVRRQLFRGLAKLFKRASGFKGPNGGGFWVAPHWWFLDGIGREDSDGGDDGTTPLVGPPYRRALAPRARQQAHAVLRATQVDMIFVEDGVGYRKLEKVLRLLLELYDVHGGRRRAEELHFRGLPKVKVMIHEYEPGNPFQSDLYPEPKFDDLSRVRVLHLFRDRGGQEELVEPPFDASWTPAPTSPAGVLSY